jgi:glycosyltransferase involved in cell wall biosynthesis
MADRLVIGTVASLRREKNLGRLIQAFAGIAAARGAELVIVGDGAEREGLEQLARQLNVARQVHFAGQSDRPEEWYRRMDIFALSSDTEQMPLAVLEAMAAGLPVAATDVGDVAQMVSAENWNFVVPADNFAAALSQLAANEAARRAVGVANMRKARKSFDERDMAERYAELIG